MNPPQVLLERSFLRALVDELDERHHEAVACYRDLVDSYEDERLLLVAVSDHLRGVHTGGHTGLFAPVDQLHVAAQHRRAARRMRDRQPDADLALTLVMCERHKVSRITTFDQRLAAYQLDLLPATVQRDPSGVSSD